MAAGPALATAPPAEPAAAPIFRDSLVKLMRAHDTYGVWAGKSDDQILGAYVLTREQRRAMPAMGDPDPKVLWRIDVFYTAVGYAITRRTGLDATPIVKISAEGFGRVLITAGRLLVLSRVLRDVHRFGFDSMAALTTAGDTMVADAVDLIARFPAVAGETP